MEEAEDREKTVEVEQVSRRIVDPSVLDGFVVAV